MAALVALFVVLLLAFSGSGHSSAPRGTPPNIQQAELRFTSFHPVELRGRGFRPDERVRLTVHAGKTTDRTVTSTNGTFDATFSSLRIDRCTGAFATARGSKGSRAATKLPLPACLPARSDELPSRIP